jgi:hypothetical protein
MSISLLVPRAKKLQVDLCKIADQGVLGIGNWQTRANLAQFMLAQVTSSEFVRKAPGVSARGGQT